MTKYFAIKDHKILSTLDITPFSVKRMDEFCKQCRCDDWFELDDESILKLFGGGK